MKIFWDGLATEVTLVNIFRPMSQPTSTNQSDWRRQRNFWFIFRGGLGHFFFLGKIPKNGWCWLVAKLLIVWLAANQQLNNVTVKNCFQLLIYFLQNIFGQTSDSVWLTIVVTTIVMIINHGRLGRHGYYGRHGYHGCHGHHHQFIMQRKVLLASGTLMIGFSLSEWPLLWSSSPSSTSPSSSG